MSGESDNDDEVKRLAAQARALHRKAAEAGVLQEDEDGDPTPAGGATPPAQDPMADAREALQRAAASRGADGRMQPLPSGQNPLQAAQEALERARKAREGASPATKKSAVHAQAEAELRRLKRQLDALRGAPSDGEGNEGGDDDTGDASG